MLAVQPFLCFMASFFFFRVWINPFLAFFFCPVLVSMWNDRYNRYFFILYKAPWRYLSLLRYLLGVDVVSQVRSEVAVRVGKWLLDLPQRLVILQSPLDALLQLLLPECRLGKQETNRSSLQKHTGGDKHRKACIHSGSQLMDQKKRGFSPEILIWCIFKDSLRTCSLPYFNLLSRLLLFALGV